LFSDACLPWTDEAELQSTIQDIPLTFQLTQLQDKLSRSETRQRIQGGLEEALKAGYKSEFETARAKNLLAYILHAQGRSPEALRELDEVLRLPGQQRNLVTLANKARILYDCCQFAKAKSVVEALKSLKDDKNFPDLVVMAKRDLAVNCSH
jgi:lipopolysaccharide biosynthesis regulator YciM